MPNKVLKIVRFTHWDLRSYAATCHVPYGYKGVC